MDILFSYSFIIVMLGTLVLAVACACIGSISVFKGQSLIGDAIGHATFPGVVLAFMIFGVLDSAYLIIGAIVFGILAFHLIQKITDHSKVTLDSALALILSGFFGLGLVLKSYVQGHPNFNGSQGIDDFIFGQAAYMLRSDVYLIIAAAVVSLLLFYVFYQPIKIYIFDQTFSQTLGIKQSLMNGLVLIMTISLIAVGLKAVGAILIVNLLIAPTVIGRLWCTSYPYVLALGMIVAGISAFIGTYLSTAFVGIATGPAIILVLSCTLLISLIVAPSGPIKALINKRRVGNQL